MIPYVVVNTGKKFSIKVELPAIEDSIKQIFKNDSESINLVAQNIAVNNTNTNVNISISYQVKNLKSFAFETKKLIFLIEQKIYSLINKKPNNINLIFEGTFNHENK